MKVRFLQLVFVFAVTCFLPVASIAQNITQRTGPISGVPGLDTGLDQFGGFICVGTIETPGGGQARCNGQLVAASAFAAAYAKGIFDRLNETNARLVAVEQKLQESAAASEKTRASVEKMASQMSEAIQQIVIKRFDTLPTELLNDPVVKERLKRLQEDIIKDIKDSLPKPSSEPTPE
ncbi:MAG TPA: hypothetical protein VKC61_20720 [Pyrinomonadaceae bacterium]|nr:hypothetical protein [Pyrinomonadaceae bacterium]